MTAGECPFKVGEAVIFTHRSGKAGRPGYDGLPNVGEAVTITEIVDGPFGKYLHWQGTGDYPGGALHWSEFKALNTVA
jgi:hypothetical protein